MPAEGPADIVIACCRDESDIIVAFIDFYLDQGFDRVCLVDNGSVDGTVGLILAHAGQDRVCLLSDPRPGYDIRLFEYYERFARPASRWVFFVDIDEFVWVPGGIKTFAEDLPASVTVLEMATAEMIPEPFAALASPLLTTRRQAGPLTETKVVWKAGVATKIYCGKHAIEGNPIVRHRDDRLFIRHYHTRSEQQFRRKLENRIESEEVIQSIPGAADRLSVFAADHRAVWLAESQERLQPGGWGRELERLAAMPWVEETAVRDWYRERHAAVSLERLERGMR